MASSPDIVLYTKAYCGYCAAAKGLLREKGVSWREIDIGNDEAARNEMVTRSGRRTVPQIFIGAQHVGGFDDLAALDQRGQLDALLGIGG